VSLAAFTLVAAVVVLGAFVQGTVGVGFALIVAPVLGVLTPELLPVCLLALMVPLNAYIAWRERTALDWSAAGWITSGRFLGTFGGLWVLAALSPGHLSLLIGLATILAVAVTLISPSFTPGHRAYFTAGIITGVTETATGIGGPPLALVYQHQPAPRLRATIAFCFLVGQLISLAFLGATGRAGLPQFAAATMLVPPLVLGAMASRLFHHRVRGRSLRLFVLLFALLSGTVLLFRG
jgi:uncharacterized membrane protein YfcA